MTGGKLLKKDELKEEVALITGSGSGIGAATARRLAKRGVRLALLDQDEQRVRGVRDEITKGGGQEPLALVGKVEESDDVDRVVTQVFERFKRIDILVNSAGSSTRTPFLELDEEAWDKIININLKGTFLYGRAAARLMVKQRKGAIVNISSSHALTGAINVAHYSASKAGVLGLTKSMALELAPYGVRVNAIAPGPVDTPLFRGGRTTTQAEAIGAAVPLGRIAQPDDIAAAVDFLVGPGSVYVTGQTLHVNGGLLMP